MSFQAQATVACSIDNVSVRKVTAAFQSADGAWWELRADVADKNVLTPSTPSMGISSAKIKDDLSGKFSGAVVRIVSDKFQDIVSARDFGAFGMSNDYTTELQTFLNQMKPTGLKAWLPRGEYGVSSTLVLDNAGTNYPPGVPADKDDIHFRTQIVGDGAGTTVLKGVGPITVLKIQTGLGRAKHGGFSIVRDSLTLRDGFGVLVDQSQGLIFEDVIVKGFQTGVVNQDSFSVTYIGLDCIDCLTGFAGVSNGASHANDINFVGSRFTNNVNVGASFVNPVTLNIRGGTFESNGSGASTDYGLAIFGAPNEGSMGLNCEGVYFEKNWGGSDIYISNSGDRPGLHRIVGNTFNRIDATKFTINNIMVKKQTAAFMKVVISENAFNGFNNYVPSVGRKYWVASDGGGGVPSVV
ncbi:hypothetical protein, partial [Stenotrophomonas maltophilia group sp. RNC7]|uniref:hypothetical protein n=1 Tax=Stenotrophomonas maltophilia group sp. RNC7 TaxID=3071467 RepID=UPI0027DF5553